jgi:HPt (histidine-containing phosphotransfer) domain-containing protein
MTNSRSARGAGSEAFDGTHLMRQAGGDFALAMEVLSLFRAQGARLLSRIAADPVSADAIEAAHALKGASRAIGAFRLADAADALETGQVAPGAAAAEIVARLAEAEACMERFADANRPASRWSLPPD